MIAHSPVFQEQRWERKLGASFGIFLEQNTYTQAPFSFPQRLMVNRFSEFIPEGFFPLGFRSVFIWPRSPDPLAGSSAPFFGLMPVPWSLLIAIPSLARGFSGLPARRGPGVGPAAGPAYPDRPLPHCPFSVCSPVGRVTRVLQCGQPLTVPVTLCNCFCCILLNKDMKNNVIRIHGPVTQFEK